MKLCYSDTKRRAIHNGELAHLVNCASSVAWWVMSWSARAPANLHVRGLGPGGPMMSEASRTLLSAPPTPRPTANSPPTALRHLHHPGHPHLPVSPSPPLRLTYLQLPSHRTFVPTQQACSGATTAPSPSTGFLPRLLSHNQLAFPAVNDTARGTSFIDHGRPDISRRRRRLPL
jgi:hypothetical protein